VTEVLAPIQALLDRLGRIDRAAPAVNRSAVERALVRHFEILGIAAPDMTWAPDAESGFRLGAGKRDHLGWATEISKAERAADRVGRGAAWTPARNLSWPVCAPEAETIARVAAEQQAATSAGEYYEAVRIACRYFRTAAYGAIQAVSWLARTLETQPPARQRATEHCARLWHPFIDAFAAGLWLLRITTRQIIAVPRPVLRMDARGRLHSFDGAAVMWPDGARYCFWHGVRVPEHFVYRPDAITTEEMLRERNLEVRRLMLERIGFDRLILDTRARPAHMDECGALYRLDLADRDGSLRLAEPMALVHVTNSTTEPDGTRKRYFLRVPPWVRTAREAVAWTFGLTEEQYRPSIET
jgi:hypothetical protein